MKSSWISCDGHGETGPAPERSSTSEPGMRFALTRRGLLAGLGIGALSWIAPGSALSQIAVHPALRGRQGNVLVVLFLRGGADGLSFLVPAFEENYYRLRPGTAVPAPGRSKDASIRLDGRFGLHPSLAPLMSLFETGRLVAIPACGSMDDSHSHFEAMSAMERGLATQGQGPSTGWIARHMAIAETASKSALRAVAIGNTMPDSLRGATRAALLESVSDYHLNLPSPQREDAMDRLAKMYGAGDDEVTSAGRETLEVVRKLSDVRPEADAAHYPNSDLGHGLQEVAALIRADVGLEIACLDKGGWDTHVGQGSTTGWLPSMLDDLAKCLASFASDLGRDLSRVNVVVMSEFGRRVEENSGLGTDHGHGGLMFVMGGGLKGPSVQGVWPGLDDHQLSGPGDVQVTTDYRSVLAELLETRLGNTRSDTVFEGFRAARLGFTA